MKKNDSKVAIHGRSRQTDNFQAFINDNNQQKVKLFLDTLKYDVSLDADLRLSKPLSDLLYMSDCPVNMECVYRFKTGAYEPLASEWRIDLAKLFNMLLREQGYEGSSDELMDYVLSGHTADRYFSMLQERTSPGTSVS